MLSTRLIDMRNPGMGLLRLLLAVSVVLTHAGAKYTMAGGDVAVQAFFMISGFLIQMVLLNKYNGSKNIALFWKNRFLRIYPLYYFCIIFTIATSLILSQFGKVLIDSNQSAWAKLSFIDHVLVVLSNITIIGQEQFLFTTIGQHGLEFWFRGIDHRVWPLMIVPQAWTLSLELMFYIVAPFLSILSNKSLIIIVVVTAAAKVSLHLIGLGFDPWTHRIFFIEIGFFLLGMLSYRYSNLLLKINTSVVTKATILATLCVHPAVYIGLKIGLNREIVTLPYVMLIFASLPALLKNNNAKDSVLGELSYPVYLIHFLIILITRSFWIATGITQSTIFSILAVLISLLCGKAMIIWLERPIDKIRQQIRIRTQ